MTAKLNPLTHLRARQEASLFPVRILGFSALLPLHWAFMGVQAGNEVTPLWTRWRNRAAALRVSHQRSEFDEIFARIRERRIPMDDPGQQQRGKITPVTAGRRRLFRRPHGHSRDPDASVRQRRLSSATAHLTEHATRGHPR